MQAKSLATRERRTQSLLLFKSAENKCVYVSISDVRFFTNEWYNNILIRTAKNEQDYYGGFNHRTTLNELEMKAMELLEDFPF